MGGKSAISLRENGNIEKPESPWEGLHETVMGMDIESQGEVLGKSGIGESENRRFRIYDVGSSEITAGGEMQVPTVNNAHQDLDNENELEVHRPLTLL